MHIGGKGWGEAFLFLRVDNTAENGSEMLFLLFLSQKEKGREKDC